MAWSEHQAVAETPWKAKEQQLLEIRSRGSLLVSPEVPAGFGRNPSVATGWCWGHSAPQRTGHIYSQTPLPGPGGGKGLLEKPQSAVNDKKINYTNI